MGMSIKRRPSSLVRQSLLPRLFLGVGVILIGSISLQTPVEAKGGTALRGFSATTSLNPVEDKLKNIEKQVLTKQETVEEIEAKLAQIKADAEEAKKKAENIDKQLADLQERVDWLADLWVKPVKYSSTSAGNSYAPGNCTWYVKQKRPDIGSFWGNANAWYYSAQADGFRVGSKPKIHAIGVTHEGWAGHVVFVEKVSLDGSTVTISEMNYMGLYNMNTRTVPASSFQYIYEKI